MTFPQNAVVRARILLNAPLPSLFTLAGLARTQLCSGDPGLSFLNLRPSLLLVLGLVPLAGVFGILGTGGGASLSLSPPPR